MPDLTPEVRAALRTSIKTAFDGALSSNIEQSYTAYATVVDSTGSAEFYEWLGDMPDIREWIDERHYNELEEHGYYIKNRDFEGTLRVKKTKIEDGELGSVKMLAEALGKKAKEFPDVLCAEALEAGWTARCYDGQPFYDMEHPHTVKGEDKPFSNKADGPGPAWYLVVTDQVVNPIIFQDRKKPEMKELGKDSDMEFERGELAFGPEMRCNAGYSFPHLIFASKKELTPESYREARDAIESRTDKSGKPLGFSPTLLIVPTSLQDEAREILESDKIGEKKNTLKGSVTLLINKRLKRD